MIPARLLTHSVTVVRAGVLTDRYGNTTPDWASATRHDVRGWLEPMVNVTETGNVENTDERSSLAQRWLLLLPPGTDIGGRDRVEHNGETFEVIGPPHTRVTPRGPHHVVAVLQWREG